MTIELTHSTSMKLSQYSDATSSDAMELICSYTPMLLQEQNCSLHSGNMDIEIKGWWDSLNLICNHAHLHHNT